MFLWLGAVLVGLLFYGFLRLSLPATPLSADLVAGVRGSAGGREGGGACAAPPAHRDFRQVKMDSFMPFTKCVLVLFDLVCIYRDGFMLGYGAAVSLIKNGVFELHDCCPTIDVPLLQQ